MWGVQYAGSLVRYATTIRENVLDFVKSWIPPRVINAWHLDVQEDASSEDEITTTSNNQYHFHPIYTGWRTLWQWSQAFPDLMYCPARGYYLFETVHTSPGTKFRSMYLLSAKHLSAALQMRGLFSMWALSDFGLCTLLSSHFLSKCPDTKRVFAILIDGKDVTNELKPYMSSIVLDDNLTADALCKLHAFVHNTPYKKDDTNSVVLVDYNLDEVTYTGDEILFMMK